MPTASKYVIPKFQELVPIYAANIINSVKV